MDGQRPPGARGAPGLLRIAVLIDVPLFSDSVAQALGRTEDFEAHGFDPHGGGEPLARYRPHIVLVDAGRDEAAALVSDLAQTVPDARVVAVAMPESDQQLFACAEAGLAGLVPWDATLEEVVATLRAVAQGELPCSPRIAAAWWLSQQTLRAEPSVS